MARPLRIEQADTFYHVINRGNARGRIFRQAGDYAAFLDRVGRCAERFDIDVYSYVLMSNHYHLLLKTRRANLSQAMQWLGVAYSAWYNARHRRSGHLFQGRFKSFLVQEQDYLYRLLLYVHRNPLRTKRVERLRDYRWSSYAALAFQRREPGWFDPTKVYRALDIDAASFRRAVRAYDERRDDLFSDLHCGVVLGSAETVATLRKTMEGTSETERPQVRRLLSHGGIEERIDAHRRLLNLEADECRSLLQPTRHRSRPKRDLLIYLLWREGRHRLADIGAAFAIGYPAVSAAKTRAEAYLKKHAGWRRKLGIII